jgi:HAMP domain-containing protein
MPRFRLRILVSFSLLGAFLAAALAGAALYLRPEGSLASWSGWRFLGVDKKGWEGVHTLFVALLFILAAIHVAINRKALAAYLRARAARPRRPWLELAAAVILLALFLAAALNHWPPLQGLMDLRSDIKAGRFAAEVPPPAPEADKMSLRSVCALASVPYEEAAGRLRAAGIEVPDPGISLAALAKAAGTTPERVFSVAAGRSRAAD